MRSFKRIGKCSMPNQQVKGVQGNENKYCVWYQIRSSLGRWLVIFIWSQSWGINSEIWVYRRVRFRSCETMGYGPTMWINSRKGGDVLHDHDSKACQRVACQLCRQQCWYQGRGTKRTIFLLVETRRTNRQGSRPSVVTGMSSTIVTRSYWQSLYTKVFT